MKLVFLLLQFSLLILANDPEKPSMGAVQIGSNTICPQYLCKTSKIKSGCASYSNEDVIMEKCFDDWYCDWSESSNRAYQYGKCILKRKHYKFRKNIGEYCYQNEDCKSYYCTSNKCSVLSQDTICVHSHQCGKGLLCDPDSNTCQKWLATDASCSAKPTMCNPQTGCVSIDNSLSVCTKYYSLTSNTVSVKNMGQYGTDSSFFCSSASFDTNLQKCLESALKLSGGYPITCADNTACQAQQDASRYSECLCFPNTQGVKYCNPFPGDIPEVITLAKEKVNQDFSKCYNYEIFANINGCGYFSLNEYTDWAPQIKAGTWGSCYNSVNMSVNTYVSTQSTGSATGSCPAIKCLETGNNVEGYCFSYIKESHIYYVQNCPNDYLCGNQQNGDYQLISSSVLCKEVRPKQKKHKGESCWVNSDCFSGMCGIDKLCTVYTEGSSCTSNNQCGRSLVCKPASLATSSYTCQNWLNIGDRCTSDNFYLCRPFSLCISSSASDSGTCQGYYSVEGGSGYYQIIGIGAQKCSFDYMCRSGAYNSASDVCFTEQNKLSTFPLKCTENQECQSTNYKTLGLTGSDGTCACTPNTQGQKYCAAFMANIDSDYYEWAYNYFKRDLRNCFSYEIGAAFGGSCEMGTRYHDLWERSIPSELIPSCGRDVLFDEERYENTLANDLIYLYVFSSRMIASVIFLCGILLIK